METVTQAFRNSIYPPSRQITAKVAFEISDPSAQDDATVSVLTFQAYLFSRSSQIINGIRDMSYKYATFEPDYFLLDGSMHIPPQSTQGTNEIGYWSGEICDSAGVFSAQPQVTINFTIPHNSIGLSIAFDTMNNEYPTDFTINVKSLANALIHSEVVTGNTSPIYTLEYTLQNYGKIEIIIAKWAKGNRRARITEIDFGLIKEYEGTELINLHVVEEMDLVGSTVPSNEIKFTLDNQERLFNILNPEGIFQFIMPKQNISAYMGVKIGEGETDYEFVSIGKYYLTEWQTDEGALTTTFTARDIFDTLETIEYNTLTPSTTLYDLAVDILTKANVENYFVDTNLDAITTNGFSAAISSRVALQNVSIAGRAVIYQDRQGKLIIKRIEPLTPATGFITFPSPDTYVGLTTPEVTNDYEFQAIDFESAFAEPQVKLNEVVQKLTFVINTGIGDGTVVTYTNPIEPITGVTYKIENPLINTMDQAGLVALWMFSEYNMRAHYTANWRQNPALVCGDAIMIEDSFGQRKKSRITKQEFQFEGFLSGVTETIGGV